MGDDSIKIASCYIEEYYFAICADDVHIVITQVSEGRTFRHGGFRHTIYLLLMAGF